MQYNTGSYNSPEAGAEMFIVFSMTGGAFIGFQFGEGTKEESPDSYNLLSYNVSGMPEQWLEFSMRGGSFLDGVHGADSFASGTIRGGSKFHGEHRLDGLITVSMQSGSMFDSELTAIPLFITTMHGGSVFGSDLWLGADIQPGMAGSSIVGSDSWLGALFHTEVQGKGAINSDLWLGAIIQPLMQGSSYFFAILSAESIRYLTTNINVTIPPGGELRIDSDVFTAFLGQQNIIHLYNGDWINFNRNTRVLSVEAGTGGNLTGDIVYTERFL